MFVKSAGHVPALFVKGCNAGEMQFNIPGNNFFRLTVLRILIILPLPAELTHPIIRAEI